MSSFGQVHYCKSLSMFTYTFNSVVGQPASGLLIKVLKMRNKGELSGGHWTFVRKMFDSIGLYSLY